jgi:hypothetical protein
MPTAAGSTSALRQIEENQWFASSPTGTVAAAAEPDQAFEQPWQDSRWRSPPWGPLDYSRP